jgi:hypothetical protein
MTTYLTEISMQRGESAILALKRTESCGRRRRFAHDTVEMVVVGLVAKRWNTLTPLIQF